MRNEKEGMGNKSVKYYIANLFRTRTKSRETTQANKSLGTPPLSLVVPLSLSPFPDPRPSTTKISVSLATNQIKDPQPV